MKAGIYFENNLNSEGFSAPCFGLSRLLINSTNAQANQLNTNHPHANALRVLTRTRRPMCARSEAPPSGW